MERFTSYMVPILGTRGKSIVFTPHIDAIEKEIKLLKKANVSSLHYFADWNYDARAQRKDAFERGHYKLMYVTPQMYIKNEFLREFINELLEEGSIQYVVINNAQYCLK